MAGESMLQSSSVCRNTKTLQNGGPTITPLRCFLTEATSAFAFHLARVGRLARGVGPNS